MRGYDREVRAEALKYGYVLVRGKSHNFWRHPNGATVTTSKTPSDAYAMKKIAADFRRRFDEHEAKVAKT